VIVEDGTARRSCGYIGRTVGAWLLVATRLLAAPVRAEARVSFDGDGPARIGMTPAHPDKAMAISLRRVQPAPSDKPGCYHADLFAEGVPVRGMPADERVVRIDVDQGAVSMSARSGIGVVATGSSTAHACGPRCTSTSPTAMT
jgi:hypothetical protein